MNDNKIMQQISAIFGILMVLFYLGAGVFLIFFFKNTSLNRAAILIFGSVLIFYGIYRGYRTYINIVNLFFKNDNEDE